MNILQYSESANEEKRKLAHICDTVKRVTRLNGALYVSILVIYLSMFLNNVLLSSVVPVLPDMLNTIENSEDNIRQSNTSATKHYMDLVYKSMKKMLPPETEKAAVLLSSKSVIQLAINPLVAMLISKIGYYVSLLIGNIILLATSFAFAFGNSFIVLILCRGLHGIASIMITISGMCICAKIFYQDENSRSKYMGIILSSEALGILVGYSFGAFTYNLLGKSTPFVVTGLAILTNIVLLILYQGSIAKAQFDSNCYLAIGDSKWCSICGLLEDGFILTILGAVFISSSTVAVLEPCLPYWLIENIELKDWQTGLMFLPDSFGYLLSTSTCGILAYKVGRWKMTIVSLIIVGCCSIMIPNATSLVQLSLPHFGIGLGIGATDCALIPLLARYVDLQRNIHYGSVYALQQVITSTAYVCGALLGGGFVDIIGFSSVMRIIGFSNVVYAIAFLFYGNKHALLAENMELCETSVSYEPIGEPMKLISIKVNRNYHSVGNSEDSD
ncbi:chromaffin granule amine transporter-like [Planococcus citri]|uniref:chromaffin granule amine transporter-like n=1 Tax=Planococcus citri TaxID=170843 RepID=UPI0031F994C0